MTLPCLIALHVWLVVPRPVAVCGKFTTLLQADLWLGGPGSQFC